jgi:hypothetical protein
MLAHSEARLLMYQIAARPDRRTVVVGMGHVQLRLTAIAIDRDFPERLQLTMEHRKPVGETWPQLDDVFSLRGNSGQFGARSISSAGHAWRKARAYAKVALQ